MLFREGGGQPYDTGFIDDVQVCNVQRKKLEHIHYTKRPVPVGQRVLVKLDWERRFVNKNYTFLSDMKRKQKTKTNSNSDLI